MALKFPNWNSLYGNLIHDKKTGQLTGHAKQWLAEIKDLTKEQLENGLKTLSSRKNPGFPPNSMEFNQWCRLTGFNQAMNDICWFMKGPSDAKLEDPVSYTLWKLLDIQKSTSETIPQIEKRAKEIYLRMTGDDILEIPVELPPPPPAPEIKIEIKLFQMLIAQKISNHNPRIWLDKMTYSKLRKLFDRGRSLEVHECWIDAGRPDDVFEFISKHFVDLSGWPKTTADPLFGDYLKRLKENENEK